MFSTSDKTRGKEKMLVQRAYGIDDLVSPALSIYIYIHILEGLSYRELGIPLMLIVAVVFFPPALSLCSFLFNQ